MKRRRDWDAKRPRWKRRLKKAASHVYVHHGGTRLSDDSATGEAAAVRAYQRHHMNRRGWSDVAYSFLVGPTSGTVYEGRGWGIKQGATRGRNGHSYSICVIGDTSRQTIRDPAVASIRALIADGQAAGYLIGTVAVRGHRDAASTACPGETAYARLSEMKPAGPAPTGPPRALPAIPAYRFLRLRRPRARGRYVRWVQGIVGATPDGIFGPNTARRVRSWQASAGLAADGIVGPVTDKHLRKAAQ